MTLMAGKIAGAVALILLGAAGAWQVQSWRYSAQLTEQSRVHTDTLNQLSMVGASAQKAEQDRRFALEQRLSVTEQSHFKELSDAKTKQVRLRDSLATSDLRLSVLLTDDAAGGCSVPATSGSGCLVHDSQRAQLDPAHAQRIVAITDEGDRGLIALAACQEYVRQILK